MKFRCSIYGALVVTSVAAGALVVTSEVAGALVVTSEVAGALVVSNNDSRSCSEFSFTHLYV